MMSLDCWIKHLFFTSWYFSYITAVAAKGYLGVTAVLTFVASNWQFLHLTAIPWKENVLDIRAKRLVTNMFSEKPCSKSGRSKMRKEE